jgi:hypothetical protein
MTRWGWDWPGFLVSADRAMPGDRRRPSIALGAMQPALRPGAVRSFCGRGLASLRA